ncbi:hypothetical protein BC938DRAFT_478574 [Jimgerdemannia flammicorona]|uniref:Uncharacterized protein n=1 Tax=Jimgerdemannia flammicorona TaxID=994334 RepID=A0A433QMM3_9FUNG|nr:hypothetical protein BC938DRAFT_478574 [Jimgerdemannia flammicorona]
MTPNDLCAQRWLPRLLQEEVDVRSGFTREGESDVCMKTIWEEVNGGRLGRVALNGREMTRAGSKSQESHHKVYMFAPKDSLTSSFSPTIFNIN